MEFGFNLSKQITDPFLYMQIISISSKLDCTTKLRSHVCNLHHQLSPTPYAKLLHHSERMLAPWQIVVIIYFSSGMGFIEFSIETSDEIVSELISMNSRLYNKHAEDMDSQLTQLLGELKSEQMLEKYQLDNHFYGKDKNKTQLIFEYSLQNSSNLFLIRSETW